jgi:hypothetical protein
VFVLACEELSGAAKPALNFVGDEHDSVSTAKPVQASQVSERRHDEATFAKDGFDNESGDRPWIDVPNEVVFNGLHALQGAVGVFRLIRAPVAVGVRNGPKPIL